MLKNVGKYLKNVEYVWWWHLKRNYSSSSSEWKSTIGLEIHAQLNVSSKLFSSGSSKYGLPTNGGVNLFDAAIPGTLPILNKKAVELAVLTALALKCDINPLSLFDRKHYFYSDLPNGYQITQQRLPLATNGSIDYAIFNSAVHKKPYYKRTRIKQVQLEQDSGKSYHSAISKESFIDLNRAGIALIEIVFEPDLESAEEAAAVVKELCLIMEKIGSCTCKMEEGALRVDANVSVSKGGPELGVRTEIKNIGSIRGVVKAIDCEISRQVKLMENGVIVSNQTLAWSPTDRKTVVIRDKEEFHDYRFMPEPNLPPLRLVVDEEQEKVHEAVGNKTRILDLRHLRSQIPQLPQEMRQFLMDKYKATDLIAYNLVNIPILCEYFLEIAKEDPSRDIKIIYQVLIVSLLTSLYSIGKTLSDFSIPYSRMGELVDLRMNTITNKGTEAIIVELLNGSKSSPKELVKEMNLTLLTSDEIRKICLEVIEENPNVVEKYCKGKSQAFKFLLKAIKKKGNRRLFTRDAEAILIQVLNEIKNRK